MPELHWIRPLWLIGLPIVIFGWWWLRQRDLGGDSPWRRWVDPELRDAVIAGAGESRGGLAPWFGLIASVVGCVALAGPSFERVSMPVQRGGDALVVALDLSRSMDASDIKPSRLERARLKLLDVLGQRVEGETALIVFSANAFIVTPLTTDNETIANQIRVLETGLMPTRGSYPESGIVKAQQLLERAQVRAGRVLLLTDGGNLDQAMEAARALAAAGHSLSILGVGTQTGGPIPAARGGFVKDTRGNIVLPKVNVRALERLARAGGGRFAMMTNNDTDIQKLALTEATWQSFQSANDSDELEIERWRDAGPWLLLLSLPLVAWLIRRFVLLAPVLVVILIPGLAEAAPLADWFKNPDQRGHSALEAGDNERAQALFEDPAWQATAAYRQGDYEVSAELFTQMDGVDGLYNRGTALAQAGQIEQAKAVLREALVLDPNHEDAQHNLMVLESLSELPKESAGGQQDAEQQGGQQQQGESGESTDGEQQSADSSQGQQDSAEPSGENEARERDEQQEAREMAELMQALMEAEEQNDEASAESLRAQLAEMRDAQETEQALEQWLRRVPDDPGGLLRAKFLRQYQRRRTDQDGNMLWPDDRSEPW